jgi:hypothetical protein
MGENYKENQKLFYKTVKSMREEKESPLNYFQEFLEGKEQQDNDNENEEKEEHTETQENRSQEQEINKEEFKNAVKKMKLGKAAGHDQITPEMIKYMGKQQKNCF